MTVGNGAPQHIEFTFIHFTRGMGATKNITGKTLARQKMYVCQGLRGKGFVHINQG